MLPTNTAHCVHYMSTVGSKHFWQAQKRAGRHKRMLTSLLCMTPLQNALMAAQASAGEVESELLERLRAAEDAAQEAATLRQESATLRQEAATLRQQLVDTEQALTAAEEAASAAAAAVREAQSQAAATEQKRDAAAARADSAAAEAGMTKSALLCLLGTK